MEPELQTSTGSIRTGGNRGLLPALYQTVWRWHFYAGIIFAPFLILLAFSGSMYLFKPQIEGYLYKDLLTVREVGASRLSPDQLSAAVKQQHPGLSIQSITLPDDAKSTVTFSVMNEGAQAVLYADPYDGKVYGMMNAEKTFSSFFKKMHSQLLLSGTLPNRLVEMAACWGIVLTVTGLYLWWPRGRFSIWGTVLPRLGKRGSRPFWRDLHAVPAFWLSLFILILIATGLPWSGVLGGQIDRAANATNTNTPPYAYLFSGQPESITVAKEMGYSPNNHVIVTRRTHLLQNKLIESLFVENGLICSLPECMQRNKSEGDRRPDSAGFHGFGDRVSSAWQPCFV
ncbi:PepSY domain-containing protein [Paenibacillus sp. P22]|uniref:PepSY-associated TM helix domain-containing protein n=1 Tax=Paenibacillus sp. P22 TaxID=483908 RepID=UPI001E5C65FA|nr:PepSY domain-containing protein [Paenibacillus sp. P22]